MASDERETEKLSLRSAGLVARSRPRASSFLLVEWSDGSRVIPISVGDARVVGRAEPSDVVVADSSLSRQHARFVGAEAGVAVEDLGSTNGTTLAGVRVELADLAHGDKLQLGAVTVTVLSPTSAEPWGDVAPHDRFVAALSDEVERAQFFRRPCAVAMIRFAAQTSPDEIHASLRALLRPVDHAGRYAHGTVEICFPELSASAAEKRLAEALRSSVPGANFAGTRPFQAGVAAFPEAGRSVEELLGGAWSALAAATPSRPVSAGEVRKPVRPAASRPSSETRSPRMRELLGTIERVAKSSVPVLILGETGTGKELLARAVHDGSARQDKPLLCINCAAIPANLVESVLFGHERGAFTGAAERAKGVFEAAHTGTVFFDEIAELPLAAQAVLLRVLEAKTFMRVGSTKEVSTDTRVVAATHKDLERMVEAGTFRQDLYYRLNTVTLELPPLRDRREDIPALASDLLAQATAGQSPAVTLDADVLDAFMSYAWPGNIRELRNVLERAAAVAASQSVTLEDLPERLRRPGPSSAAPARRRTDGAEAPSTSTPSVIDLAQVSGDYRDAMEALETEFLRFALEREGWNQTHTARRLGMPLRTLVHKIKVLAIKRTS